MLTFLADNPGYGFLGFIAVMSICYTLYRIFAKPTERQVRYEAEKMKQEAELNRSRVEFLKYVNDNNDELRKSVKGFKEDARSLDKRYVRRSLPRDWPSWPPEED